MTTTLLSKHETQALLEKHGLAPNKNYGQNFLIDKNMLNYIASEANLTKDDIVLEVGPGNGNLTQLLAESAGNVIAVEIDRGLFHIAATQCSGFTNALIIHDDILDKKTGLNMKPWSIVVNTAQSYGDLKIVANLPYAITTPLLVGLLTEREPWARMVLTMQKEAGDRLTAQPGTKDYGILSVVAAVTATCKIVKKIPANLFWPAPKIESVVAVLEPNLHPDLKQKHIRRFANLAKVFLSYRRKTLANAIKLSKYDDEHKKQVANCLTAGKMDLTRRGETFNPEEILQAFQLLRAKKLSKIFRPLQHIDNSTDEIEV